jgi:hypothetical protein
MESLPLSSSRLPPPLPPPSFLLPSSSLLIPTEDGTTVLQEKLGSQLSPQDFMYWDGLGWKSARNVYLSRKLDFSPYSFLIWREGEGDMEEMKRKVRAVQPTFVLVLVCMGGRREEGGGRREEGGGRKGRG